GDQWLAEMQSSRRCGDRSALAREQRLVPVPIIGPIVALDVGRQRDVPDRVDRCVDRRTVVGPEPNDASSKKASLENLAVQRVTSLEQDARTRLQLLARMHERLPVIGVGRSRDEQALDHSAAGHPTAEQARRKNARVVDDYEVARVKKIGKRGDRRVADGSRCPREVKQARTAALRGRLLCNELGWKIEVELADVHVRDRW